MEDSHPTAHAVRAHTRRKLYIAKAVLGAQLKHETSGGHSMAKYWWQCISCGDRPAWLAVCESRSVAAFVWDELAPSGWDQSLLRRKCKCGRRSLYITYRLQRSDPERVSVKHIAGLPLDDDYLPMVWETFRHGTPRTKWVDFKYQRGRSPWGLTKRLVLKKEQLARLLRAYEKATVQRKHSGSAKAKPSPAHDRGSKAPGGARKRPNEPD